MTTCYKCDGATAPQKVTWTVNIGGHDVAHELTESVCTACGDWTISSQRLGGLELRSALDVLQNQDLSAPVLKDVRKALGLKQTELGEKLDASSEVVSAWEEGKRPMESWLKQSLIGLVYVALLPHA